MNNLHISLLATIYFSLLLKLWLPFLLRQKIVRSEETPEAPQDEDKGQLYRTEMLF